MTVEEANTLIGVAKANYGYAFKNMTDQDKVSLVKSWAFVLQDVPADIVNLAFMQLLAVSKWLPTPAEIRNQVRKMHFTASTYFLEERQSSDEQDRIMSYILESTYHMRNEPSAELALGSILQRGYGHELGTNQGKVNRIENRYGR